jgi:hypothetical protein
MSLDLDEVIKNTAAKTGYGLHKDDPQMALVEIINQLTDHQQADVVAALEKYREVHEGLALQWRGDARNVANSILNAALDAGGKAMSKGMSEGAAQVVALVSEANRKALEEQREALTGLLYDMKNFALWMIVTAFAVIVVALLLAQMKT